MSIVANPRDTI